MKKTMLGIAGLLLLATCLRAGSPTPLNERQARPAPSWVTGGIMYQIQPRAFTPEGTLKAATARLSAVAELGVDILYLCPVFVSDDDTDFQGWSPRQKKSGMNNPRNPYRMKDYYHVDPEYGTDDDLKAFIAEAHRLGTRVLLDMVYLHCGPNAVFLAEHPDFVKRDAEGKVSVAGWGFPALNFANPELREYLWRNMEYWVREFGADGFRCDVSDGIPLDFWETARERLDKIRPEICLLAEGTRREDQLKAFDLDYGWGFRWDNAANVRKQWEKMRDERPRGGARFIRFIDNHDIANDAYDNRIEKAWGTRRVNATLVALFTLDGVPMLYNGQEVADTARHSIFGRMPIDWTSGEGPTGRARFEFCKELCAMRRAERTLTRGEVVWLDNDQPDAVLSFLRRTSGEEVLSVVNLSDRATEVRIAVPQADAWSCDTLLADAAQVQTAEDGLLLKLEGFGYLVARRRQRSVSCAEPYRVPNIVFILADDLGYGDLGSYGQQLIRTPRLDQIAAEGMRFTQHYAGAPTCQPSRCVLFTGKHTGHARIRANSKRPLHADDFTLSHMFHQAGYATGGIGKWALGDADTVSAPWRIGMDEFFGYLDQTHAHTYYPDFLWRDGQRYEIPGNRDGARTVYSHDLFAAQMLDFIRRHKDRPFFFYAALTIPHAEMAVPDDSLDEYRGKWPEPKAFPGSKTYCPQDQPRAVRAAMITRMDRDIGRMLDLLDELELARDTLVLFTSDNGPITAGGQDPEFFRSAGPLRGLKFSLYEGGIRVPLLARWPEKIAAGTTSDLVSDFADMFPTFAELIGVSPPPGLDGVSLVPTLLSQPERQARRELFYWEAAPQQALRLGDWKAYRAAPHRPLELYDLANDIGEQFNLAAERPEIAAKLERRMAESRVDSPDFPLVRRKDG